MEFYVSTIGVTSVIITVIFPSKISCSNVVVSLSPFEVESQEHSILTRNLTMENRLECSNRKCSYWRVVFREIQSSTRYSLKLLRENKPISGETFFTTLQRPKGRYLYSFGILPDLHINSTTKYSGGPRLYHKCNELARKYVNKLADNNMGCKFIILNGDVCDSGSKAELSIARDILVTKSRIPCHPVIGNHECYSGSEALFNKTFGLDKRGQGQGQGSLGENTQQMRWLKNELEENKRKICLLFTHFSFVLHPCVEGWKNDGMQQFYNWKICLRLFSKYPNVKVVFAGHKNVPSFLVDSNDLAHVLSAQLMQTPCGFDVVDVFEGGLVRKTHEIEEIDLVMISKNACGRGWKERFGSDDNRHFVVHF